MCGIFGFSGTLDNISEEKEILKKLFLLSETRGKEACGMAIANTDEISYIKLPITASEFIKKKQFEEILQSELKKGFNTVIGHSRLVTNGYEHDNDNNQPIVKNGIVVIHNGIIVNQNEIWNLLDNKSKISQLDTELIPTIIGNNLKKGLGLIDSVKNFYKQIEGIANVALLFDDKKGLVLATNNGSLFYTINESKTLFVFASEKYILTQICNQSQKLGFSSDSIFQLYPNNILSVTDTLQLNRISFSVANNTELEIISRRNIREIDDKFLLKNTFRNTSMEYSFENIPIDFVNEFQNKDTLINSLKRCVKCILPETFPNIHFDSNGVCNFCHTYQPKILKSKEELIDLISKYQSHSKEVPDCVLPFSGGRDSSYAMHYIIKELGLNPIAFSYDWGMLTDLARRNQSRMCAKVGVEHIVVSADIRKKRNNIKLNVEAWLHKPHLGTIPLFMAGDKHYFYYNNLIMKQNNIKISIMGENHLEKTGFKTSFSGAKQDVNGTMAYNLSNSNKIKMIGFYGKQFLKNPKYINSSLIDTSTAFFSYYGQKHDYINLFDFIDWDEKTIETVLLGDYNWEKDPYFESTWRIGDGTAAFYNYIYYTVAGFTENDTFRSNQIREGKITRQEALEKIQEENKPRWESIQWYCNTISIDWKDTIKIINNIKPLYGN